MVSKGGVLGSGGGRGPNKIVCRCRFLSFIRNQAVDEECMGVRAVRGVGEENWSRGFQFVLFCSMS